MSRDERSRDELAKRGKARSDTGNHRDTDRKLSIRGRRGFLRLLSAIGFSTATLAGLTQETLAEENGDVSSQVTAVEAYRHTNHEEMLSEGAPPEREKTYFTIPRDQWVRAKGASNASTNVLEQLPDNPYIRTAVVNNGGELEIVARYLTVAGQNNERYSPRDLPAKTRANVNRPTAEQRPTPDEVRAQLPSAVTGTVGSGREQRETDALPVRLEERTITNDYEYTHNYDPLPGGCHTGDGTNIGTVTTPAYYDYGETYGWIHCGHAFGFSSGTAAYQNGDNIGTVGPTTSQGHGDACFIEEELPGSAGSNADYDIAEDSHNSSMGWRVSGSVAEDRLLDMLARGDTLDFQGCNSGRQIYSDVQAVADASFAENCFVTIDAPSRGGDSGGPYYYDASGDDDIYIAAVNQGHYDEDGDGDQDAGGWALHWVENYLGVRV